MSTTTLPHEPMKCANCKWWLMHPWEIHNKGTSRRGQCRRRAPNEPGFPNTYEHEFCGEFEKKDTPE